MRIIKTKNTLLLVLLVSLIVAVIAGGICVAVYLREAGHVEKDLRFRESTRAEIYARLMSRDLQSVANDLRVLSSGDGLRAYLETGRPEDFNRAAQRALYFSQIDPDYDKIRFLNEQGREILRINHNGGIVPPDQLQNKAGRPFFERARPLDPGQIFISAFDLNIENARVEIPYKPTLRLSTPVFDASGRRRGVYVINYLGENMITRFQKLLPAYSYRFRMLNSSGYWIKAAQSDQEWGFMLPERAGQTLAKTDPGLWQQMTTQSHGQVRRAGGLFTWYSLKPAEVLAGGIPAISDEPCLFMATEVTAQEWATSFAGLRHTFVFVGFIVLLLTVAVGWFQYQRGCADAELHANREMFRRLFENAPDAIILVNHNGQMVRSNAQMEKLFGYAASELTGMALAALLPQRYRTRHEIQLKAYFANPQVRPAGSGLELIGVRKDGSEFPLDIVLSPLEVDNEILAMATIRDITERKQVEKIHLQFRALFESLPGLYLVLSPELKIVAVSDAYLAATMTARDKILGRGLFEVFPDNPDDPAANGVSNLRSSLNRVKENLVPDTMAIQKYDVRRPDGVFEERFWSPVNSPVLGAERQLEYIIHRVEDVTDFIRQKNAVAQTDKPSEALRTRMEHLEAEIFRSSQQVQAANQQLEAANHELEAFSYSVSHDLRAPLRHIDGFLDLLTKSAAAQFDDRSRRYVKIIGDAAKQMGNLIDDLLVFSRMGRAEMRRQTVDLNGMIEQIKEGMQQELEGRNIVWKIARLPTVEADPPMLRQVVANLIDNAVKYTRTREVAEIEIGSYEEKPGCPVFFIRDNGVGFDMQYVEKLFGVFQRLHRADEFEGTGIGLANIRRIIHRHGGRAWAEGKIDKGATFYYTLT